MLLELREDAIIDSFKEDLKSLTFVAKTDYPNIEQRLDVLADGKERKTREKTEAAKWLWGFFLEESLSDITNNLRGCRELRRYFDDYAEYEDLLFALDPNHRDHVIHSIWVMLLGLYLRKNFDVLANLDYGDVVPSIGQKSGSKSGSKLAQDTAIRETIDKIRQHEVSLWCLVALTHDLGYPIQKTSNANDRMAKMVRNFGFLQHKDFEYGFTIVHQTAIDTLLNIISACVFWDPQGAYRTVCYSGRRLDFAKSFERLDHGIISAYLIQMYLDCICEAVDIPTGADLVCRKPEVAAKEAIFITLLNAISAHTSKNCYWNRVNFVDVLLFLSDELEEFSRYSHSPDGDGWINVGCRTECEITEKSLQIVHVLDKKTISDNVEVFFKSKVEKMWNRLEPKQGGLQELSITCRDVRKALPIDYIYTKTLAESQHSRDVVKRSPGKSSEDIMGFLDGTVNLLPQVEGK